MASYLIAAALVVSSCQQASAQPVRDVLPQYEKRATREETREATLRALGGSSAAWGRWWVCGPFDLPGGGPATGEPLPPESLLSVMGNGGAGPDLHGAVPGGGEWREAEEEQQIGSAAGIRLIDLHSVLKSPGREFAAAYLYRSIEIGAPTEIPINVGSDDGVKLWLNGVMVLERAVDRALAPEADRVVLKLAPGVNHLFVKVTQTKLQWQFSLSPETDLEPAVEAALDFKLVQDFPAIADRYYRLVTVPPPRGVVAEVGGLDVLPAPDSRPILSTRRGDVYLIENAYAMPPTSARWRVFASGLAEPLGVVVRPGATPEEKIVVYAAQRPELTRLVERTGDAAADSFESFCAQWRISGNYHEYAFGPKFDREGNAYVTLNLAHTGGETTMGATAPTRGCAVKISPAGEMSILADGLRSPDGLGMWTDGEMFYTDNQGDYVATCKLSHLKPGSFHGHQASLKFRDGYGPEWRAAGKPVPEITQPAVWFPYKTMGQSTTDLEVDTTEGKFGPFAGQFFTGDQTLCTVMRADLERVERADGASVYQGVCIPFREGFLSGVHRLAFAPDGSLFVGMTDRGWGSTGPKRFGLQRLVWTGVTPFEIRTVRARPKGFRIEFTLDVPPEATDPSAYSVTSWTYKYHPDYGSPEIDKATQRVTGVRSVGSNAMEIDVDSLRSGGMGYVHEIAIRGMSSAPGSDGAREPLLNPRAYYTLQVIPAR